MRFKRMTIGSKSGETPLRLGRSLGTLPMEGAVTPQVGPDIADMIIANSIFFLTCWSDFSMGVWALVMADRLLFAGDHEETILATAGIRQLMSLNREKEVSSIGPT